MTAHPVVTGILLGLAVAICFLASLGVLVMRDALQRLNFSPAVTSLASGLIAVAVFVEDGDAGTRIKTVMIVGLMFLMNGVLSHTTGRAIYIRRLGRWGVGNKGVRLHRERAKKPADGGDES